MLLKEKLIALRIVAACGIAAGLFCCVCPNAEWQHLLPIIVYKTCLKSLSNHRHIVVLSFLCGRFLQNLRDVPVTYSSFTYTHKVFIDMKRHKNFTLLLMLVLLVAVGQMAQTIYIPAIADMAISLNAREGAVQSVMAAYLLTYGVSQLFYGPLSDRVGRRPVILIGMSIFMLATLVAITTHSLTVLIIASAIQGMGTGVGGVMARTRRAICMKVPSSGMPTAC